MAYDEVLAGRLRDLAPLDMKEKNVFGARCWVLEGNMAFGATEEHMLVRLGNNPGPEAEYLTPFDPMGSGKPMAGWFLVDQDDLAEDHQIAEWMGRATAFVQTLPPK